MPGRPELPVPEHLIPPDDEERVTALHDLEILDTESERRFDGLIAELAQKLDVPIAYLALIARDRQWIKSKVGPIPTEAPREHAFCSHTILGDEPVLVGDATQDERFSGSPLVQGDPNLRFYAGVPISDHTGHTVGTVCVAGPTPREITPRDLAILEGFAERLERELNSRPRVLLAYAREDEELISRFLAVDPRLQDPSVVEPWSSRRVSDNGGGHWRLKDALWRAHSVVLMLSPAFLRSAFVSDDALRQLIMARELESFSTLTVLLESCDHDTVEWLAKRPSWPSNDQAITLGTAAETDRLFRDLAIELLGEPEAELPDQAATAADQQVRLFLSHAGEDSAVVKELAGRLRQAGVEVWLDVDELQPGDDWMHALEEALDGSDAFAVYIGRSGVARWIGREVRVALDRNAKDPRYRFIPILGPGCDPEALPRFVKQHHWLDLREGDPQPAEIRKLVASILRRPAEAVSLLPPGEPPFRGLLTFGSEHAHLFFGRDQETSELLERIQSSAFLAVIGDSGSGKSSLVRAGLIPALHRGHFRDGSGKSPTWRVATIKPGSNPFRELVNGLLDLLPEASPAQKMTTQAACAKQLGEGTQGLCNALAALVPKGERCLLVIDQFEEVFTQSHDPDERDRFIDTLLEASNCDGERPLHIVVTMRADFYSHCFEHPKLPAVISTNQYAVRAIAADKLSEVIEKPALLAGIRLEAGLVEAILFDLGEGPGNLPLLEHTLLQLWEMRTGETLTHASYEEIGRVQGALEHHAERVYDQFDERQKQLARKLMLGLVVPTENAGPARRRARIGELLPTGEGRAAAEAVLGQLVEERLLMVRGVNTGAEAPSVEADEREPSEVKSEHSEDEDLARGWLRLQARVGELLPSREDRAVTETLLQQLVEERLLEVRGVSEVPEPRDAREGARVGQDDNEIEVTHEALLRGWQRLQRWLEEDREFLFWRQRTHAAFNGWNDSERDSGALLRGGPLAEAQRWLAERGDDLSKEGQRFIRASIALAVRQKRIRGAVMATIAIIGVVALLLALVATRARRAAEQNLLLATTAVDEMLTRVGSEALADVPQLEEVRQELLQRARALYQQLGEQGGGTAELRLKTAAAPALMAKIDRQLGAVDEARAGLQSAIESLEGLVGEKPANPRYRLELGRTHNDLGWLITDQIGKGAAGEPREAAGHLDRAVELLGALLAADPDNAAVAHELARSHLNRGWLRSEQGELEAAELDYRAAIDRVKPFTETPGDLDYDIRQQLARTHNQLANLYKKQKKPAEATVQYENATELLEALVEERPKSREYQTELAMIHGNLALHLRRQDPGAAEEHSRRAIALFDDLTDALPAIRSEWAIAHRTQGLALLEAGRVEEADESLSRASTLFGELLDDHPERQDDRMSEAVTLLYLGVLRVERGQEAQLGPVRERLLATLAKLPPESRERIERHPYYPIIEGGA